MRLTIDEEPTCLSPSSFGRQSTQPERSVVIRSVYLRPKNTQTQGSCKQWFLQSPLSWAIAPECRILVFTQFTVAIIVRVSLLSGRSRMLPRPHPEFQKQVQSCPQIIRKSSDGHDLTDFSCCRNHDVGRFLMISI